MSDGPNCLVCGATYNVEFPVLGIKTTGFKFGEICDRCDVGDTMEHCHCSATEPNVEACRTHQIQFKRQADGRKKWSKT